ncbi:hypothetical protein ES708_10440 [subsurface metagenome]
METELENLKLTLTSPRKRAPGTIVSYLQTARTFLTFHGDGGPPTAKDYRRFFIHRREKGISERTLAKEFVQLNKLAIANNWPWPFAAGDRPVAEEEPFAPAFTPEEIQALILARDKYSKSEAFYLAISTTWGLRREELVRIRKRDYNKLTIRIKTAKHGRRVEHLIPGEINPILQGFRPKLTDVNSLSYMFYRILKKAGIERRKGYGWRSIRRTLRTALEWNLAADRLPLSLVADYMGWSKTQKGIVYGGAPALSIYAHPEIKGSDPYAIERRISEIHPFLKFWSGHDR